MTRRANLLTALLLPAVLLAAPLCAQDRPDGDGPPGAGGPGGKTAAAVYQDRVAKEVGDAWTSPPVAERDVSTAHSITAGGRTLNYHAHAGTITLRDAESKPVASVFYTAYTLDGANPSTRPLTFFWNGGPGSSTIWLRMGSFGPMRVQTTSPETIRPAPYAFGPNADTLLDKTDMVFIDMIGTGYSRPLGDAKAKQFWGVDEDADAFAKTIMRWTTKFSRWSSPKFLFGESYGTTRAAAVAYQLQDRGMALNGVVLLSSILNYGIEQSGYDQGYVSYLPSYAATAWYHHKLANRPAELAPFLEQVRQFAAGPYAQALAKGQNLTPAETDAIANQMSAYIGISPEYIKRANLRVDLGRFEKELLRDQRLTVGRFDSRYTGVDADAAGENPDYDASDTAISGAFIATFSDYIVRDLGYKTDMPYLVAAYGSSGFEWDFKHRAPGGWERQNNPDVAVDLAAAMRTNPYLHVLSLNGYYDMATPFFATEYDIAHMMLEPAQKQNLEFRYYPSGHMIYLNPDALHQLHADLASFYDRTVDAAMPAKGHR
ncbi:MAG: peptidase S10 [Proteobacteria bacterium]|nr:peptidase S10 [Pseudomonadota bacterium]